IRDLGLNACTIFCSACATYRARALRRIRDRRRALDDEILVRYRRGKDEIVVHLDLDASISIVIRNEGGSWVQSHPIGEPGAQWGNRHDRIPFAGETLIARVAWAAGGACAAREPRHRRDSGL